MPRPHLQPRRHVRRPPGTAPLLVMLVLAVGTACGTTAPQSAGGAVDGSAAGAGSVDGLSAPAGDVGTTDSVAARGSSGEQGGPGAPSVTGPAAAGATTTGGAAEDAVSAGGSTTAAGGGGDTGLRGVTATTVRIGIGVADDGGAFTSALGLKGLESGDARAQIAAVVEDVNRRGGFAGRRVELAFHSFNTAEYLNDPDRANQAACATWTEDEKVFAVVLPGGVVRDLLLQCLAKRSTPLVFTGGVEFPKIYESTYERYPDFYAIGSMSGGRFDELSIDRLVARGFFEPWDTTAGAPGTAPAKIGLVGYDSPWGELQIRSIRRQLARHGLALATVVLCPQDFNGAASCTQSSVLRLRSDGVTHVFGAGALSMQTAENQRYRPRYFIEPGARIQEDNAPPAQLAGAMAASYLPALDVRASKDPGDPTPATTYCRKVMQAAGQSTVERSAQWSMQAICDAFFVTKAAADAGGQLTTAGLRAGFDSLGSRVPSALTWTNTFGPGQHAGVRGVRDLEFDSGCGCFAYVSSRTWTDSD